MGRLFTLFTEKSLENAIAADADFEETGLIAAVSAPAITVITFFQSLQNAVATHRRGSDRIGRGAGSVLARTAVTLPRRTRDAGTVTTEIGRALLIVGAGNAAAIQTKSSGALIVVGAGEDAATVLADAGWALGSTCAGLRAFAILAKTRSTLIVVCAICAASTDAQT